MRMGFILTLSSLVLIALWLTARHSAEQDTAPSQQHDLAVRPLAELRSLLPANVAAPASKASPSFEMPLPSERLVSQQSSGEPAGLEASTTSSDAAINLEMVAAVEQSQTSEDVIGRPFPLSSSIAATCKRDPDVCKEAHGWLEKMVQEPRDQQWAARAEESLRETILAEGDKFSIRTLECRQTVCAVEVASIHGPLFTLKAEELMAYRLWGKTLIMGYETNENEMRVTVTVWIYERK